MNSFDKYLMRLHFGKMVSNEKQLFASVLKNFTKFTEKLLKRSRFLIKLQAFNLHFDLKGDSGAGACQCILKNS